MPVGVVGERPQYRVTDSDLRGGPFQRLQRADAAQVVDERAGGFALLVDEGGGFPRGGGYLLLG